MRPKNRPVGSRCETCKHEFFCERCIDWAACCCCTEKIDHVQHLGLKQEQQRVRAARVEAYRKAKNAV